MATSNLATSFSYRSFVRGYHDYLRKYLVAAGWRNFGEPTNSHDSMAVMKDEEAVGHSPNCRNRFPELSYFLPRGNSVVTCEVTGSKLNRGVGLGLEVPCVFHLVVGTCTSRQAQNLNK